MRDDTQLLNNGLDSELDSYDTAEDIKRTDYIYMVSGNNLVISLNAELDHHLADEMREVIDDIIDKRGVDSCGYYRLLPRLILWIVLE